MPTVTVLMSVYNGLPYLPEAIESILQQEYTDFEFLIIDDASTDSTMSILRHYSSVDSRIRVLENVNNRGLGPSLARGVIEARGELIARIDADDIALGNRLITQIKHIKENPQVDILGSWAVDIDENGEPLSLRRAPTTHSEIGRLIWTNPMIHSTVLFKRSAILSVGNYRDVLRAEDYDLWFRCLAAGKHFANVSAPLVQYRFTQGNLSRNTWAVAWTRVVTGWRGCLLTKANPIAYVAVLVPLLKNLVPSSYAAQLQGMLNKIDPRRKS